MRYLRQTGDFQAIQKNGFDSLSSNYYGPQPFVGVQENRNSFGKEIVPQVFLFFIL